MIGEIINGKYRIDAAFSESHLYEIFTAFEQTTETKVVIKILRQEMAENPERVKGFSDEIRSFAKLSHPLITEVLDVDLYGERPYLVSPLVDGKELYQIIKDETLSFADCCTIIQDLATVLQYAADQNVEHRTIKLSNLLRSPDGKLKVLSFTHPRLKLAGRQPRSASSGIHADLFFLGSTFYEMLTGESIIRRRGGVNELWDMKLEQLMRIRHPELAPEQMARIVDFASRALTRNMKIRFNSHEEFLKSLADLTGIVRSNNIRSRARQLSMASQVVDALNGRMSNVNLNLPAAPVKVVKPAVQALSAQATQADTDSEASLGFTQALTQGNLALATENQVFAPSEETGDLLEAARKKSHLRLVKTRNDSGNSRNEAWQDDDEVHWLRNPVIFMGLCLILMVMLILFW